MRKYIGTAIYVAITLSANYLFAQTMGSVTTQVVDQSGNPVESATVAVVPADASGGMGVLRECLTDNRGVCSQNLQFGKYHVTAKKMKDGYPDMLLHFYGQGVWPATTEITPQRPTASVTVKLGPKAAFLVLHVVDDVSGDAIKDVNVTLHPAADPHDFVSTGRSGPDVTVLIPPDEEVLVTVSAGGHQPWHLEEHKELSSSGVVRLHSQDRQTMTVRLKRQ